MTGIDEISRTLGAQEANLKNLGRTFDKHCADDDARHRENIEAMGDISNELRNISDLLKPVVDSVAFMRPIVDGYQASRLKTMGALSLASSLLIGVGWLVTSVAGAVVKWVAGHF